MLEDRVEAKLKEFKVEYEYESLKLPYTLPSPVHQYTTDYTVGDIVLEVKGWLRYADQRKMLAVKQAHPTLDIRFVFQDPDKKMPGRSKLTHAMWADKHGFPYISEKDFNKEWLSKKKPSDTTKAS